MSYCSVKDIYCKHKIDVDAKAVQKNTQVVQTIGTNDSGESWEKPCQTVSIGNEKGIDDRYRAEETKQKLFKNGRIEQAVLITQVQDEYVKQAARKLNEHRDFILHC